jgi:hypothetical protein
MYQLFRATGYRLAKQSAAFGQYRTVLSGLNLVCEYEMSRRAGYSWSVELRGEVAAEAMHREASSP